MNRTEERMTRGRKEEIANTLSEFDILTLDWYIANDEAPMTIWDACAKIGIPQWAAGDIIRRLVGLGLLTTVFNNRPVHTRLATATDKGKMISVYYNTDVYGV